MDKKITHTIALSAQLIELDGVVPTEIRLVPDGKFRSARDNRPIEVSSWIMDAACAADIIASNSVLSSKFLVDYDHQTLHAAKSGTKAPAAGWGGAMEWRDGDGLYAVDMDWNDAAACSIAAREYRYISPVIDYCKKTGRIINILMAALTNYPALDNLNDLAAAAADLFLTSQETPMDIDELLERLRYMLNLPTLTSLADIIAELDKLKAVISAPDGSTVGLSALLAARDTEIAALSAQIPDPAQFVPIAMMTDMQTELAALSAIVNADNINKLIAPALADGRLLSAQKEWAETLGKSNLAALSGYLATAQPIAALSGMQTGGKSPDDETEVKNGFKPPDGFSVSTEQAALHAKIVTHQKTYDTDYKTAALAVGAGQ